MAAEDEVRTAGAAVTVIADIIKAAGDDPQVKEAGKNLGKTAVTLTSAINNLLLPIAAINFSIRKARDYFEDRFAEDLEQHVSKIPPESIVEPKASLVGPALQGLAFSHEEPSLRELYLSLVATAMDGRNPSGAHPAFVDIIRQLTAIEATHLPHILRPNRAIAIVEYRSKDSKQGGFQTVLSHVLNARNEETGEMVEDQALCMYIDNWIRLGLITVHYDHWLTDSAAYEFEKLRPEYLRAVAQVAEGREIVVQRGMLRPTAFGTSFFKATDTNVLEA